MLVCTFLCALRTRDRGCSAHPVFPAPFISWEGDCLQNPDAIRAAGTRSHIPMNSEIPPSRAFFILAQCHASDFLRQPLNLFRLFSLSRPQYPDRERLVSRSCRTTMRCRRSISSVQRCLCAARSQSPACVPGIVLTPRVPLQLHAQYRAIVA